MIINKYSLPHLILRLKYDSMRASGPIMSLAYSFREMEHAMATGDKTEIREYYCELVIKSRDDGTMFVTSDDLPMFSAVVKEDDLDDVLVFVRQYLEKNVGRVHALRFVTDISERVAEKAGLPMPTPPPPPAHVLAELAA